MKLGFFTTPIHPLEKDWRQSLKEDREAFLLADELGSSEASMILMAEQVMPRVNAACARSRDAAG